MRILGSFALVAVALSATTATGTAAASPPPAALADAVAARTASPGAPRTSSPFHWALTDLDGDGRADAIALLDGSDWCGSGGCTMLIFRGTPAGFVFVSECTVTRAPVRALGERRGGWLTLSVHSGGEERLLRFAGGRYPGNPSVQPPASAAQAATGKLLIADEPAAN